MAPLALPQGQFPASPYDLEPGTQGEPRAVFFRRELHSSPDRWGVKCWMDLVSPYHALVSKGINEEICFIDLYEEHRRRSEILKEQHDTDQMVLLHHNLAGLQANCGGVEPSEGYFAGHWLYLPGTCATANIGASTTQIAVADLDRFRANVGQPDPLGVSEHHDDVVLVPRVGGVLRWDLAEQARVTDVVRDGVSSADLTSVPPNHGCPSAAGLPACGGMTPPLGFPPPSPSGGAGGPAAGGGSSSSSFLVVERGQYGTVARDFSAYDEVWVAPHAVRGPWGKKDPSIHRLMWQYNFSLDCPRNAAGQSCADAFLSRLTSTLLTNPDTDFYDGVQFDIARMFRTRGFTSRDLAFAGCATEARYADLNNDGLADGQTVALQRRYAAGLQGMLMGLRVTLGPDRVLLGDGGEDISQRGFGILNGMESEGFPSISDAGPDGSGNPEVKLEAWSSLLNKLDYWARFGFAPNYNYIVSKRHSYWDAEAMERVVFDPPADVVRLAIATSVCTDSLFAPLVFPAMTTPPCIEATDPALQPYDVWDELRGGPSASPTDDNFGWLGRPDAAVLRLGLEAPDQLFGLGAPEAGFATRWYSDGQASIDAVLGDHVRISPNQSSAKVYLTNYVRMGGASEAIVSLDLWGDDASGWEGLGMPRAVQCRWMDSATGAGGTGAGTTSAGGQGIARPIQGIDALAGSEPHRVHFMLRGIPTNIYELVLEFEIEGTEPIYIRNLQLRAGSDCLVRSFDNGVAIANPSDDEVVVPLGRLFPGRDLRHIDHSANQMTADAGSAVGTQLTVPAKSGRFLIDRAPRNVSFDHTATYGAGPLSIGFTGVASGLVDSWHWDFGDGSTGSGAGVSHSYAADGVYDVTATATGGGVVRESTKHALVVIQDGLPQEIVDRTNPPGASVWSYSEWNGVDYALMTRPLFQSYYGGAALWSRIYDDYMLADVTESSLGYVLPTSFGQAPAQVNVTVPPVRKRNSGGGDGTIFSMRRSGNLVLGPRHVQWHDVSGAGATYIDRVNPGDSVEFHLGQRGTFGYDGTYVAPNVQTTYASGLGPTTALFESDLQEGAAPLTVRFKDRSLFDPSVWSWSFGDGGQSAAQNPVHTFSAPGSYDVTLAVDGGSTLVLEDYVRVHASWRSHVGFPTSNPGGNTYGGGWSAWEYDRELRQYIAMAWNTSTSAFQGQGQWSRIYGQFQSVQERHTVRGWTAPSAGIARVEGAISNGLVECGDGVKLSIRRRTGVAGVLETVWGPVIMEYDEKSTLAHDIEICVEAGDDLFFHVDPRHESSCDGASWVQTITLRE